MKNHYQTSNTELEAEWMHDKVWNRRWYCSNCSCVYNFLYPGNLQNYCGNCGAMMKNPQFVNVEYNY